MTRLSQIVSLLPPDPRLVEVMSSPETQDLVATGALSASERLKSGSRKRAVCSVEVLILMTRVWVVSVEPGSPAVGAMVGAPGSTAVM